MKHLEIELKTLLKKEEYDHLKKQFSRIQPVLQKNYYLEGATNCRKYGIQSETESSRG